MLKLSVAFISQFGDDSSQDDIIGMVNKSEKLQRI